MVRLRTPTQNPPRHISGWGAALDLLSDAPVHVRRSAPLLLRLDALARIASPLPRAHHGLRGRRHGGCGPGYHDVWILMHSHHFRPHRRELDAPGRRRARLQTIQAGHATRLELQCGHQCGVPSAYRRRGRGGSTFDVGGGQGGCRRGRPLQLYEPGRHATGQGQTLRWDCSPFGGIICSHLDRWV